MVKQRRVWLGIIVSLLFLGLFLYRVDFASFGNALASANYLYVPPAALFYFVGVWLRAIRWRYILEPLKQLPVGRLFSLQVIGYMANNILPARIGEFVRAYILGEKEQISKTSVLATIVVERIFDGISLIFLLLVVAAVFGIVPSLQTFLLVATVVFVVMLSVFIFVASSRQRSLTLLDWLLRFVPEKVRPRVIGLVGAFIDGLAAMQSPMRMLLVFLFSAASWIAESVVAYILVYSFSFRPPFHAMVAMTSVSNLGTTIPSGPGGLGTFDALVKWVLVLFDANWDPGAIAAYTILFHVVVWLPVTVLGLALLWAENMSLAQVTARNSVQPGNGAPGGADEPKVVG